MSAIAIIFTCIFSMVALATEVPVMPGDRILIKGLSANVSLSGSGGNTIKISGIEEGASPGTYSFIRRDNVFEIYMNEYSSSKDWLGEVSKSNLSPKKIEISGLALPIEIHLRSGVVISQKWQKEIKIAMTEGKVTLTNGNGEVSSFVNKGDISILNHVGKLKVDSFSGSVLIKNLVGDLNASLFAGQMMVEKSKGNINLTSSQSSSKVVQSSGTIQFDNGKGSFSVQNFQGRMEGQTTEGMVTLSLGPDSEADIKSRSGKVSVQLPANVGASLSLVTSEGDIVVPSELKVTKFGGEKSVRAKLRGDAQKISVNVRSQEGIILVK